MGDDRARRTQIDGLHATRPHHAKRSISKLAQPDAEASVRSPWNLVITTSPPGASFRSSCWATNNPASAHCPRNYPNQHYSHISSAREISHDRNGLQPLSIHGRATTCSYALLPSHDVLVGSLALLRTGVAVMLTMMFEAEARAQRLDRQPSPITCALRITTTLYSAAYLTQPTSFFTPSLLPWPAQIDG